MRLILASASPRRADLLAAAGFTFDVHAVDVDERQRGGELPREYVVRLASAKSARAMDEVMSAAPPLRGEDMLVVAADTAVVIGGEILGKPRDVQDGERMLRRLSGCTHEVMTGISVRSVRAAAAGVETTTVTFAPLTEDEVGWYRESGEGLDKAGGYAIQGRASRFIPRIDGSYSNVVGLPIAALHRLIHQLEGQSGVLASRGH